MRRRTIVIAVIAAIVTGWLVIRWLNAYARPNHALGVTNDRLAECPNTPNCVSSTSPRPEQSMTPIPLDVSAAESMEELESVIRSMPCSRIVTVDEHYLHAEFSSRVFGFVDDVELLIDDANAVIHFRAAARVGYSDLGVNRRRMTQLREPFERRHANDN